MMNHIYDNHEHINRFFDYIKSNFTRLMNTPALRDEYKNPSPNPPKYYCHYNDVDESFYYNLLPIITYLRKNEVENISSTEDIPLDIVKDMCSDEYDNSYRYYSFEHFDDMNQQIINEVVKWNLDDMREQADDLLNNDDHIGDTVNIDFDPTYDYSREAPIIIIDDKQGETHVYIGHIGESHSDLIASLNIRKYKTIFDYAYYLNNMAFFEKNYNNRSNDELAKALINNSNIKKVYILSERGLAKRVAKR